MDHTSQNIMEFESLLKENANRTPLALYSGCNHKGKTDIHSTKSFSAQDVIDNVNHQIKAIQKADMASTCKQNKPSLQKCKQSTFVPVNMLPRVAEATNQMSTNNFETQFLSNTQLISITESAEAMVNANNGITQEFDSSFSKEDKNKPKDESHNNSDKSCCNEKYFESDGSVNFKFIEQKDKNPNGNCSQKRKNKIIHQVTDIFTQNNTQLDINCPDVLNTCVEIDANELEQEEDNSDESFAIKDEGRCGSPILQVTKSKTPSPLVFDLEPFENFEKLALPIIEKHDCLTSAKQLINSQIIGKELHIHPKLQFETSIGDKPLSPVLKMNTERLIIAKTPEIIENLVACHNKDDIHCTVNTKSQCNTFLEDEILFSSDEENDYVHKELQDLPLTCALETSFYEQPGMLDKTMFVGFQTASNRSIQINTASFSKAISVLDEVEKDIASSTSLAELVDSLTTKKLANYDKPTENEKKYITEENVSQTNKSTSTASNDFIEREIEMIKRPEKRKFIGFATASEKKIKLSDMALARCKKVFQNIEFEKCDDDMLSDIYFCQKNPPDSEINIEEKNAMIIKENEIKMDEIVNLSQIDEDVLQEFSHDMSLTDNSKNDQRLIGFRTASKKDITISDAAFVRTKNIFDGIDVTGDLADENSGHVVATDINASECNVNSFVDQLVQSKSHLNNKLSAENLAEATNGIHGINNPSGYDEQVKINIVSKNESNGIVFKENSNQQLQPSNQEFCGFKTASCKNIKISEGALRKGKSIFKDIMADSEATFEENILCFQEKESKDEQIHDINISEQAMLKTKDLLRTEELNQELANINEINDQICQDLHTVFESELICVEKEPVSAFCDFKDASNKKGQISEEVLVDDKKLFADLEQVDKFSLNNEDTVKSLMLKKSKTEDHFVFRENKSMGNLQNRKADNNNAGLLSFKTKKYNIQKKYSIHNSQKAENIEILSDFDETEREDEEIIPFRGFQTPSVETIKISGEPVLFERIDQENNTTNRISQPLHGFRTANNKPITVSMDALVKSKNLFKDIDYKDSSQPNDSVVKFPQVTCFIGFQTASNKTIEVSSEALAKSKALFEDIESKDAFVGIRNNSNDNKFTFTGFQTANNNPVQVSAEALAKSKAIFQELESETAESSFTRMKSNILPFDGFKTASMKTVTISAEALAKGKALFKDIDSIDNCKSKTNNAESKFEGFQTASNKSIKVSSVALARGKALFKDIDDEIYHKGNKNQHSFKDEVSGLDSFKSASAENSAKNKASIMEIDGNEVCTNKNLIKMESKFGGFQTASNKSVNISEDALLKSKKMLQDFDSFILKDMTMNKISEPNQFKGFQTASDEEVKISEGALKKTRQIFKAIEADEEHCKENIRRNEIDGGNTGNWKSNIEPLNFGFKTGNNKNVIVSDEVLKQSKKLLTGQDGNTKVKHKSNPVSRIEQQSTIRTQDNNMEKVIDTQLLSDFEETLCTEDFCKDTPMKSKRSGSPILSCPRAKKSKKFETPYRNEEKGIAIKAIKITPARQDNIFPCNKVLKENKRYKLKDLAEIEEQSVKTNINSKISNFTLENFHDFQFSGLRNDLNDGQLTIEDIKNYFINSVTKKLIPIGWLDNHLKLIIWKLLSYEIKFPNTLSLVCTAKNVLQQLKYRFERELYNAERPCLRKILEKDDTASRTMVLCVAEIFTDGVSVKSVASISSNVELLLTDGWYSLKASIDKMLTKLVYDEKITVGCKIVTNGAELINCEQGVSPWEDTSSVRLKIFGNSTRRARWDARLGYHGNAAILTRLSSVKPEGRKVSKLRLYVARVYPMLYVEKFEDGSTLTRSERLEHIHQVKYESERQTAMEKLYEEVEKELSDQESQDSLSQIATKNRRMTADSMITESQIQSIEERSNRKREKLLQNVQERVRKKIEERGLSVGRNVVTLMKVRVAGVVVDGDKVEVTKGLMSIWKPNDMLSEIIKENAWIEVMNVVPTAVRYSEIHLSAGRQSVFSHSKYQEDDHVKPYTKALQRTCYSITDLALNPTMTSDYNEIDTVGIIFLIDAESNQPFQNIYLADTNKNMICINFWGGLKKYGFKNVLEVGHIVYGTNLQRRAGNTRKSIPQFRVTEFTYFTKTPKNVIARNFIEELDKNITKFIKKKYCDECVAIKNNFSNKSFTENVSPYRFNNEHNLTKNKVFIDSPLAAKCDNNFNLTGLDFESTFKQTDTQELSPKALERKRKVNARIAKLKLIGEPPALSPMNIINKSKTALKAYKSPLAINNSASANKSCQNAELSPVQSIRAIAMQPSKHTTDVKNLRVQSSPLIQTNVASAKRSYQNSRIRGDHVTSSPVLSMNRTYVKNVNPVKLNFSNVQDNSLEDIVDHFAEEFDGSPPLSLD